MEKPETKSPQKISRREFIKRTASTVAAAPLAGILSRLSLPSKIESPIIQEKAEQKEKKKWDIEEVLLNPIPLIDYICGLYEKVPETERTDEERQFLLHFSRNSSQKEVSQGQRSSLEAGYKRIGKKIVEIRKTIKEEDIFSGFNVDNDFPFFSKLIRPLASLADQASLGERPRITWEVELGGLTNLAEWFKNLKGGVYEQEKYKYVQNAKRKVNLDEILRFVEDEHNLFRSAQRVGRVEGWPVRRSEGKKIAQGIVKTINTRLPLALAEFTATGFTAGRGYFSEPGYQRKMEVLDIEIFYQGVENLLEAKGIIRNRSYSEGAAQFSFSLFTSFLLHEFGHGVDPFIGERSYRFDFFHPEDYVNYIDAYIKMFKDFYGLLKDPDGLNAQGVQEWALNPLSPKILGIDELTTDAQKQIFIWELNTMIDALNLLESSQTAKDKEWIKKSGMERYFGDGQEDFPEWIVNGGLERFDPAITKVLRDNISGFNKISAKHLKDIKTLVEKVYIDGTTELDEWQKNALSDYLLSMKSTYMLATISLITRLVENGDLKKDHPLNNLSRRTIADIINWQLIHIMTGTLGNYLPLGGFPPDLRIPPQEQINLAVEGANYQWINVRNTLNSRGIKAMRNYKVNNFLIRLMKHVANAQRARAILWGADDAVNYRQKWDANESYKKLIEDIIFNVLELKSIWGEPKG